MEENETEWLTKEKVTHRDHEGNLLPVVETVEYIEGKPKVKIIPMTRGQIQSLGVGTDTEKDKEIIKKHLLLPKLGDKEIDEMSLKDINAIAWAIFSASTGMSQANLRDKTLSYVEAIEDWQQKKTSPDGKT